VRIAECLISGRIEWGLFAKGRAFYNNAFFVAGKDDICTENSYFEEVKCE